MFQRWRCDACGYAGRVRFSSYTLAFELRDRIAAAHARCSSSCANQYGLLNVTVGDV